MSLRKFGLLSVLTNEELEAVQSHINTRVLNRSHRMVLSNPFQVLFVRHGWLKLFRHHTEDLLRNVFRTGDCLHTLSLLGIPEPGDQFVEAIDDAIILTLDSHHLTRLYHQNPELLKMAHRETGRRLSNAEGLMDMFRTRNIKKRLYLLLKMYVIHFGNRINGKIEAPNIFNHQEVADVVGISRQTASRLLNELRREKKIEYNSENICVYTTDK